MPKVPLGKPEKLTAYSIHVLTRNEHPPAHVHVFKGQRPEGPSCKVKLGGPGDVSDPELEPVLWTAGRGWSLTEAWEAEELVKRHRAACWKVWRDYNGDHQEDTP